MATTYRLNRPLRYVDDYFDVDDWFTGSIDDVVDELVENFGDFDEFLTANQLSRAVERNQYWATQLGWQQHYDAIVRLLAAAGCLQPNYSPAWEDLSEAVACWQLKQRGLSTDGIIGPNTWRRIQPRLGIQPARQPRRSTVQALCPPPANLTRAERTALEITTRFETNVPFGCAVSATDGISMGMIQWNLLAGTLQNMLARFEQETGRLRDFFGSETPRLLRLIALRGSRESHRQAVREANQEGLANRWRDRLLRLCADPHYCRLQTNSIINQYMRPAQRAARQLGLETVRGLSMMFDINVGDGFGAGNTKINQFNRRIQALELSRGYPLTEREKLVEIANEAADLVRRDNIRENRRARRLLIAQGQGSFRRRMWNLDRDHPNLNDRWQG